MEEEIKKRIKAHDKLKKLYKKKQFIFGLLPIIIPIITEFVVQIQEEKHKIKLVSGIGLMLSSVCSGVFRFMNLGSLVEKHDLFGTLYSDLLFKAQNNEIDDVILREELLNLDITSPIDISGCC